MNVLEAIKTRKSVRKYLDKMVPDDLIGAVIEAGTLAPSSGNKQNWKFVIVKDHNTKENIAKHSMEQYWITRAPALIVVCSENTMIEKFYGKRGTEMYSRQNCAAAVENMILTAHSLGLGSCWIGAFDEKEIKYDLSIPENTTPQVILTLGYPTKEVHKKTLKQFNSMVYLEKYGNMIKDVSPFLLDWSSIMQQEAEKITQDLKKSVFAELKDSAKSLKGKWDKISNKFKERYMRRLDK